MSQDEIYHRWVETRVDVQVPDGFADQVMSVVQSQERHSREAVLAGLLMAIARSKAARAAAFSIAAAACLVRIACLISPFVVF